MKRFQMLSCRKKFIVGLVIAVAGVLTARDARAACAWSVQPVDGRVRVGGTVTYKAAFTGATAKVKHTWKKHLAAGVLTITDGLMSNGTPENHSTYFIVNCGDKDQISFLTITNVQGGVGGDFCDAANGFTDEGKDGGCDTPGVSNPKAALINGDDTNDVKEYALKGYARLCITPAQIEDVFKGGALKHTLDILDPRKKGAVKPLYTTVGEHKQVKDCTNPFIPNPSDNTMVDPNCNPVNVPPAKCDRPAWLPPLAFRCYGNAYIGTWEIPGTCGKVVIALVCRKSKEWSNFPDDYDDINMIMHNEVNGQTLWFNTPTTVANLDTRIILAPHVAPVPDAKFTWKTPVSASNINCIQCHDNGPWMNSRWMRESGVGLEDGARELYFNAGAGFSTWKNPVCITVDASALKDEKAKKYKDQSNTCTYCHRIALDMGLRSGGTEKEWLDYTVGREFPPKSNVDPGQKFKIAYWMPNDHGIDELKGKTEAEKVKIWNDGGKNEKGEIIGGYKKHVDVLRTCIANKGKSAGKGDPCHVEGQPLGPPLPLAPSTFGPGDRVIPGVRLYADTNGDMIWDYQSAAPSDPAAPPIPLAYGTPLTIGWSADAGHPRCHVATTFPPGVEMVNGTGTGSNWLLSESPQTIGVLTVPGLYYFHIDCDDANYDVFSAALKFQISGPSPTVLHVNGIVNGVGKMAFDYPCYPPGTARPQVMIPVDSPSCAKIGWVAYNVVAGSCVLTETLTPSGGHPPRTFPDESGFISVPLNDITDGRYLLTCMGLDGLPHAVDVTLHLSVNWDPDSDGDGTPDCDDLCPTDPYKTEQGQCGCGMLDTDSDGDGEADCQDGCPSDPNKIAPGTCGCGVPDRLCGPCGTPYPDPDSDGDGTPDCIDLCPNDPNKYEPGACGCGMADPICGGPCGAPDPDSDSDGTIDCLDGCPNDYYKIEPGVCGCGFAYVDTDGDGTPDCIDLCPSDPNKTAPGLCGCGTAESECGCGMPEVDTDGDGTPDCIDGCPNDPNKIAPGVCLCGNLESVCGCGFTQVDLNCNGWPDCLDACRGDTRCCLPDHTCMNLVLACCAQLGGVAGPAGMGCAAARRCCLPNGSCINTDPACCPAGNSPPAEPSARYGHAMAYDSARGVTVLFGGNAGAANGETWEWDGTAWSQRIAAGPSPRYYHAMAYDSARGVTVLFGGNTASGENGETWEWNGSTWALRSSGGPLPRYLHVTVFDTARNVTVLFGGFHAGAVNGETWEWNGIAWTQHLVSGPSPRYLPAMAYDASRGMTVLFGGETCNCNIYSDETWEWNGTNWTQRPVAGPSPRYGPAAAYDSAHGVTVLFGGYTGAYNGETWEWNGANWTQRVVAGPSPRYDPAAAYDSARGVTVLFGGNNGSLYGDTWEWDGTNWTQPLSAVATICLGDANQNSVDDVCEVSTCGCPGDVNVDGLLNGGDVQAFIACLLTGSITGNCACADMNHSFTTTTTDVSSFVTALLSANCGP